MENNKKFNLQFFADEAQGNSEPNGNGSNAAIDYESEYKKAMAEINVYKADVEKYKGLKDKYASENAEYKKKELEKLSDEEKKAKEYQDLVDSANKMKAELESMKLEKELLSEGFTSEESEKLIKSNFAVKTISEIFKSKLEEAVKSAKAEMIKTTTPSQPVGNGTAQGNAESDFQKFQKEQNSKKPKNEIKFN